MKITIIAVGKLKESYLKQASKEYSKRLSKYCTFEMIEVKDEKIAEKYSPLEKSKAVQLEGQRILKHIKKSSMVFTLDIEGTTFTSPAFAKKIETAMLKGSSHFTFIIGGSLGLSEEVKACSHLALSFSKMTFPHQLFRIMLLEQLYRVFKINNNEVYHK